MLRIVFFGTPQFAMPFLAYLEHDWRYELVGVVSQPNAPVGRKKILTAPPVALFAKEKKIPLFQPESIKNNEEFKQAMRELNADLFVVVAYGKILPNSLLSMPRLGTVNVHPSKLPKYRGPSPMQAALANGDKFTAISVMKMDKLMDHGPILATANVQLENLDTYEDLEKKVHEIGPTLLADTMVKYAQGAITPIAQDDERATYCKLLTRADGFIDPSHKITDIWNMWRAYTPWPGITCMTESGKKYKLLRMFPSPIATTCETLSFKVIGKGLLLVNEQGAIQIDVLQEEGRLPITGEEFARNLPESILQIPLKKMS